MQRQTWRFRSEDHHNNISGGSNHNPKPTGACSSVGSLLRAGPVTCNYMSHKHVGLQWANQSYHATEALAASASQAVRNTGCHRTSSPSVGKWHMRKRETRSLAGKEQQRDLSMQTNLFEHLGLQYMQCCANFLANKFV